MEKISSRDAQALLKKAAASIRTLVQNNEDLRTKLASAQREERIRKIASDMEQRKLNHEASFEEKVAALRNSKNLDVVEEAVKLASPQGFQLGEVSDVPGAGDSATALTTFIMTGEAPE